MDGVQITELLSNAMQVVGTFAVIAAGTPTSKLGIFGRLINIIGANIGRAKNRE
jgi:hypothetical protein